MNVKITDPLEQTFTEISTGVYELLSRKEKSMTIAEYRDMANFYKPDNSSDFGELESKFWSKMCEPPAPIYGTDIYDSLFDNNACGWNINALNTILNHVESDYDLKIDHLSTSGLFFGMWRAVFPWHTEDMDLYSINYIHFGAP